MPELPEVETVARGLRQTILGRRILSVTLGKTDFIDDPAALEQHLPGRQIENILLDRVYNLEVSGNDLRSEVDLTLRVVTEH